MGSMLELWGAVLDRSLEQIAAASADAREFDRHLVIQVSNAWDNNTYPFFGAAVARGASREVLAADGFRWMANFGSDHREWVVEQAATSGRSVSLPPAHYATGVHYRDYRGLVRPTQVPLTSEVATAVVADYDPTTAKVRNLLVERSSGGLRGSLLLTVDRRFGIDQRDAPSAELDLRFEGINDLRFDLDDSDGIAIDGDVALAIGRDGFLHASRATAWIHDSWWHLSLAGRAADARTPTETRVREARPVQGGIDGAALVAASVLRLAMLEIRMVRYASMVDQIPAHRIARAFAGAGSAVVATGALRRGRDAAFRRLIEQWIAAGGDHLAPLFRRALRYVAEDEVRPSSVRRLARELCPSSAGEVTRHAAESSESEVVLVAFTAERGSHPSSVVVQAAVPEGAEWTLRGSEVEEPQRFGVVLSDGGLVVSG
jgi:hypothetical protein